MDRGGFLEEKEWRGVEEEDDEGEVYESRGDSRRGGGGGGGAGGGGEEEAAAGLSDLFLDLLREKSCGRTISFFFFSFFLCFS